jgi:pimeloyl-ACP methyl ester carboxylesterase
MRKPGQFFKAWYQFFFQLPWLPEAAIRARNFAVVRDLFRQGPVRKEAFTEQEINRYITALAQPGSLTAALNYYRAIYRETLRQGLSGYLAGIRRIEVPTLLIWGEQDRVLTLGLTENLEQWVPDIRVERTPDASHWVQNEAPERVNELMLTFL